MAFGNQLGSRVLDLVEAWRPAKDYRSESKFQNDLKDFLDEELQGGGMMDPMGGQAIPVRREHGRANADVVVDNEVGIELKRNFSNSQADRLSGQIQKYREAYPFVIVCACGLKDTGAWRELQQRYDSSGFGFGMDQKGTVNFVVKDPERYGTETGGGEMFGGGFF